MPRTPLLALASLTACGPLVPATADTSTGTLDPTTTAPDPTTANHTSTSTATPTTTGEHSTGTTVTVDTANFVIEPDLPECSGACVTCDVLEQDCPTGQKCAPWAQGGASTWNATRCVPVTGDGLAGDPCIAMDGGISGHDDCALGHMCWDVDESMNGTCIAHCTGNPRDPQCPEASGCYPTGDSVLKLCIPTCDPLASDCPDGDVCVPSRGSQFLCLLDASGAEGQLNDPCTFSNSCDPGLVCIGSATASSACDGGSTGCCTPFCQFPDAPCPNPDQQCLSWSVLYMPLPAGSEHIGVCAIPR